MPSFWENVFAPDLDDQRAAVKVQQDKILETLDEIEAQKKDIEAKRQEIAEKEAELRAISENHRKCYENYIEHRQKLQAYKAKLQNREREIREKEAAFQKIEYNALVAINRWERKEWDYLQELQASADKLTMFSSVARRRNGFRLEAYIADMLKENGFTDVEVTKASGDFGGDVFAVKNGLNYILQCKYYSQPVGIHAVQEAASARAPYHADRAVVVTNNVFTTAAQQLAKSNGVELWDCSDLARMNTKGEFY